LEPGLGGRASARGRAQAGGQRARSAGGHRAAARRPTGAACLLRRGAEWRDFQAVFEATEHVSVGGTPAAAWVNGSGGCVMVVVRDPNRASRLSASRGGCFFGAVAVPCYGLHFLSMLLKEHSLRNDFLARIRDEAHPGLRRVLMPYHVASAR